MEAHEFYKIIENLYAELLAIMMSKGEAYSGQEDKLGNFKRTAKRCGVTPELVWAVYFSKHLDALDAWLRGKYKDSEPIEGRIKDLINYLFLLYGLIMEKGDYIKTFTMEKIE